MIKGQDIICFSLSDWRKEMVSNRYHMLTRFAQNNRVFLFERPIVSSDTHRLSSLLRPIRRDKNLIIISPISSIYEDYSKEIYRFYLKKIFKAYKLTEPIFWFYDYALDYFTDEFPYLVSCYHCTEDYAHISQIYSNGDFVNSIAEKERKLGNKVDLVFAVSEQLVKTHRGDNQRSYLVANAVDYNLYSRAQGEPIKIFGDRKILGYCGNISDKINFELLYRLAVNMKNCQVVLAGPVYTRNLYFEKLKNLKNVLLFPVQPVEKLPSFYREFSVCLMPYIQDDWFVKVSQPLKLYEYMASGKPIVSTKMNCLKNLKNVVYEAHDTESFIEKVKLALAEKNPSLRVKRIKIAQQNTWDKRFALVNLKIEEFLVRKSNAQKK